MEGQVKMSVYSKIDLKGANGTAYDGSVANRFDRDYENMAKKDTDGNSDDRKGRQLDEQSIERQGRLYVDPDTLVSETGKDAKIVTNGYGGARIDQPSMVRPAGAVTTNKEAEDKNLVPDRGDFVEPYRYAPVEAEEPETVPTTDEPETTE